MCGSHRLHNQVQVNQAGWGGRFQINNESCEVFSSGIQMGRKQARIYSGVEDISGEGLFM